MLTKKQKPILQFVTSFSQKYDYPPTLEEIKKHFKLKSVATVHQHLAALQDKGYLQKQKNQHRSIITQTTDRMIQIPLRGTITAGQLREAIEDRETIAVPQSKLPFPHGDYYALRVSGDSMVEENINDGDIVLLKNQNTAQNGEKVVALVDNSEATLKKFYKEKNHIRLQPANKNFDPIIIDKKTPFAIQGVVVDVIRNEPTLSTIFPKELKEEKKFNIQLNKIYHSECLNFLKQMRSESVDLIFADPPYNLSKSNFTMKFTKSGGSDLSTNKGKWDTFSDSEYEKFTEDWLNECFRVLSPTGSIWVAGSYHNIYLTGYLIKKVGFQILNEILWHKSDATPNLSCTRFVADHENFIWARKGKKSVFNYEDMRKLNGGKQMRSLWTKGKTAGGKRIHPTQKPLWLLERIILATSTPKQIVFDPFMGSGTTAVAAKKLGRFFLGCEIDREYYEKAVKRIENE